MKVKGVLVAVLAAVLMVGCGVGPDKSREDARDTTNVDKSAAQVIAFNNHFPNIETKCDGHGHRIFVSTSANVIILPDPSCDGYVRGEPGIVAASASGSQ